MGNTEAGARTTTPLSGRTALVTGASRGIGASVARKLAALGTTVAVTARSIDTLERLALELGDGAAAIPCDMALPDAVDAMALAAAQVLGGPPDILVLNAGAFGIAPAHEEEPDNFDRMIRVNLTGPFRLLRAFLPDILTRGTGHIVTVGSIADRGIFPGNAAYAAGKFGLRALHETLRAELKGSGVRASLVSPGNTDTSLWDPIDPDNRPGFAPRSAMLSADAVAESIAWVVTAPASVNVDELRLSRA